MAYYSGQATSYTELLNVLTAACVAEGWTWADGILSKGVIFLKPTVNTTGIIIQGAEGKTGATLTNPSSVQPRLGNIHGTKGGKITFPVDYNIHIHQSPDEVYLVVKCVDYYYWLAFGGTSIPNFPGTGMWLSAVAMNGYEEYSNGASTGGIYINSSGSGSDTYFSGLSSSAAIFWKTNNISTSKAQDTINCTLNGGRWVGQPSGVNVSYDRILGCIASAPLIQRMPSVSLSETVLLPIQAYLVRSSSKLSLIADLQNARYIRIDNFEPGQIITLGSEKWKVYPFHKKNISRRDGQAVGGLIDDTGTFGWAIRYDGP